MGPKIEFGGGGDGRIFLSEISAWTVIPFLLRWSHWALANPRCRFAGGFEILAEGANRGGQEIGAGAINWSIQNWWVLSRADCEDGYQGSLIKWLEEIKVITGSHGNGWKQQKTTGEQSVACKKVEQSL